MNELDKYARELLKVSEEMASGNEARKMLRKSGNRLKNRTIATAKSKINEDTGNYIRSIKRGRVYDYQGNLSIRAYSSAPHAHLIEHGHVIKDKNGNEHGFKKGYHIFEIAGEEYEGEFHREVDEFIEEILERNGVK